MVDLHCHVLPGIDDGPATLEESVELARAAAAAGTQVLVATPHVSLRYANRAERIAELVEQLNGRLATENVHVEVRPGAEIAMTRVEDIPDQQLRGFGLGGGPWLLIEPPFTPFSAGLGAMLADVRRRVAAIVLAHPERSPMFHRDPELLASLVRDGVLTSITAGSLAGRFGRQVRRFSLRMVELGLVHNVSSDAHNLTSRPPGLIHEIRRAGLAPLEDWLTHEVPTALLTGEEIPPRPSVSLRPLQRGSWRRMLRR